jgi:hypothetical protein
MEEQLKTALQKAITFLEGADYRYAIVGGIALAQWGVARYTHDVDIKVIVPNMDYSVLGDELRTAFPDPAREHLPRNPFIVAVTIDEVIVDFLLALPGYEELIITNAVQRDLGGWSAWICSAEDLIIQKVVAGRGKDWLDVESLLIAQHGRLDESYILEWLNQFVEALEQPELLAEYLRLVEKINSLQ